MLRELKEERSSCSRHSVSAEERKTLKKSVMFFLERGVWGVNYSLNVALRGGLGS